MFNITLPQKHGCDSQFDAICASILEPPDVIVVTVEWSSRGVDLAHTWRVSIFIPQQLLIILTDFVEGKDS